MGSFFPTFAFALPWICSFCLTVCARVVCVQQSMSQQQQQQHLGVGEDKLWASLPGWISGVLERFGPVVIWSTLAVLLFVYFWLLPRFKKVLTPSARAVSLDCDAELRAARQKQQELLAQRKNAPVDEETLKLQQEAERAAEQERRLAEKSAAANFLRSDDSSDSRSAHKRFTSSRACGPRG